MALQKWCLLACVAVVGLLYAGDAQARFSFGTDDQIRVIQPTKDPEYKLGHKVSTFFFGAGCYVKDEGYVLVKTVDSKRYIPLDPEKIKELQADGTLPNPLPAYSLSFWDYLFGYSNWIVLGLIFGIPLMVRIFKKKGTAAPAPT